MIFKNKNFCLIFVPDVFDISSVKHALLETNGKISVVTCDNENETGYVLVSDGKVQKNVLEFSPFDSKDLENFIGNKDVEDIFILSVNSKNEVYCVMKEI